MQQICQALGQFDLTPPYAKYLAGFQYYQAAVHGLLRPGSGRWRQDVQALEAALPLQSASSYLIMPVQRPPRYVLLIKAIVDALESDPQQQQQAVLDLAQRTQQQITEVVAGLNHCRHEAEVGARVCVRVVDGVGGI